MKTLHRFWVRFRAGMNDTYPPGTLLGVGLTAFSRDDAIAVLREYMGGEQGLLPEIDEMIEDVQMTSLDPKHVLPNIGDQFTRGIWFPLGYR